MKKLLPLLLVLSLALVVPAMAQDEPENSSFLSIDVDFTKSIDVSETIYWNLDAEFFIATTFDPDSMAKAFVVKRQDNVGNTVVSVGATFSDEILSNSFNSVTGIVQVNQAAGSINNQQNAVAAAVVTGSFAAADAQVADDQYNTGNSITSLGTTTRDRICSSFTSVTGVVQVNQSAGSMNNQNNALALAADPNGGIVALADCSLNQLNAGNGVVLAGTTTTNVIGNSFKTVSGLVQVNQSAGSINNQANSVAIAAVGITR